ncbi:MAG: FAD-dependent oxidoreductase, partial [Verrucomicrobia bacterium]|nr:FAD-dependent oxidoreductase [Verrucomicrobiota bacterium]
MNQVDFVVIGSGVAGLSLSLKLAEHGSVAIITKRQAIDSNTAWAQGGVACVTSVEDSFDLHIADTLAAGAGLCDREAVRTIVSEGPTAVRDLMRIGVQFDERILEDGQREL